MPVRNALLIFLATACAAQPAAITAPPVKSASARPKAKTPPSSAPKAPKDETLGQCLARKGMHLYGASWCHPCHEQLSWFGDDAKNVPFTDCFPPGYEGVIGVPECTAVGLDLAGPFPTWIFSDGLRVVGTRSLKWLALSTDCPLRLK